MNNLQNLVYKLEKHHKRKIDLTLDRTFNLLKKLGNPQDKLNNVINVVGTNAKASMSYSLKSILNEAGYKCNLYTSPHLQSFRDIPQVDPHRLDHRYDRRIAVGEPDPDDRDAPNGRIV